MAVSDSMPVFLLLRVLGGGASAFVLVFGSSLVLDRLALSGRGKLAGVHFAGVGLGIAASALLVNGLEAHGFGWRALWLASGLLAAVAVPAAAALVPAHEAAPGADRRADSRLPPGLAALSLCHGLFGFGYVITATFLVAIVRTTPGAAALEAVVWLVVGLAAIPSTALWGRGGARWGVLPAYAGACLAEAVGVLAGGLWITPAGTLLASALLGGTFMGITALGFAGARALAPSQQHRSFALMTAGFGVGQIAGPIAAGWLLDRTGSFAAPSILAAAALVVGAGLAMRTARAASRRAIP
jgi:MFS family permease